MKDFLLIGNMNAITYKEIFPLIKENKMWLGFGFNKTMEFVMPDSYEKFNRIDENGNKIGKIPAITWYTNLVHNKKKLILTATYDPEKYPKYDNYDAVEVSRIKDIPYDYDGVMGVPITIFDYDLDDVEIVGSGTADCLPEGYSGMTKDFVDLYYSQGNTGSYKEGNRLEHYIKDGKAKIPYARILIKKNFEPEQFEIIQLCASNGKTPKGVDGESCYLNGKWCYARILIRRKKSSPKPHTPGE